jgi:Replicative DNA helicase
MADDSEYLFKEGCESCGSSDANAVYTDGHKFCFACEKYTPGDGEGEAVSQPRARRVPSDLIQGGEFQALPSRRIREDTCQKFGYRIAERGGHKVHVAPYFNADGEMVAQHLRTRDKDFPWVGDPSEALPFGAHCWPKTGRMLVVTEGEIDALSMSQVQGNEYPVVSIGCGAGQGEATKVRKYFAKHLDYFRGFEKVVLMFDADEPGRDSARAAAEVLGPTACIADLPLKDANEMLVEGRTKELINAMWRAKPYSPEGVVALADIVDTVLATPAQGKSYALPKLTTATFGWRRGQVVVVGAGTGAGKTDFLLQEAAHAITEHGEAVGLFFLESTPRDVAIRIAGKIHHKVFHVPDGSWTEAELKAAIESLAATNKVFLYDNFGVSEWDRIKARIRFLAHAHGVKYFVIDNLSAFSAVAEDERRELERVMAEIAGLAQELDAFMWVVSHLATPEGKSHEEGGRVMARHLKGARAISHWAHYIFGLERNQQSDDEEERRTSIIRCLKDRFTGRANGYTFAAKYEFNTGMLVEAEAADFSASDGEGSDF